MEEKLSLPIHKLLERSDAFKEHLFQLLGNFGSIHEAPRHKAGAVAASLSLEHWQGLHVLVRSGGFSTAAAVMRLQYEALLRGAWLVYAATETDVVRATGEMTLHGQTAAQRLSNAKEMLDDLVGAMEKTPGLIGIVKPLQEIREQSWRAMNSYVHAGLHPLRRSGEGFPIPLVETLERHSNGMAHMAVRLLYRLTSIPAIDPVLVDRAFKGFEDCLPMNPQH